MEKPDLIFHGHRRNKNVLTDTEGIAPCDAGARGGRDAATKPETSRSARVPAGGRGRAGLRVGVALPTP